MRLIARWWTPVAPVLGVWILFCLLLASGAAAHAVLVEAEPADGASLAAAPAELRLRFNEPVAVVAVRLIDATGAVLPGLDVQSTGEQIVVHLTEPLAHGAYLLSYRVVSADGHPVGASLRFGVGTEVAPAAGEAAAESGLIRGLGVLASWAFLATALGSAGCALFVVATRPPALLSDRCVSLGRGLAAAGIIAALARLGAAGVDLGGGAPADLLQRWPWPLALDTSLGPATAVALLGLALLVLLSANATGWRALAGLAVIASFALTGHAATASPRWLAGPTLALHVLAAAFWAGSLLPLMMALGLERDSALQVVRRFSWVASVAVAALVAAGATLTVIQLGGVAAGLWATDWGWRLLAKLVLVAGLLAIAALNRLWLTPALAVGDARGCRLRTTLLVDLALMLGVLGLTATFPLSPPPRAMPTASSVVTTLAADGLLAVVVLVPGRAGTNQVELTIENADGSAREAAEVRLHLALPDVGIEPLTLRLDPVAPGLYLAPALLLPAAGAWNVRVDVLVDDFTKVMLEGNVTIR